VSIAEAWGASHPDRSTNIVRFLTRTFVKGLAVVLPVAAAIYVIVWLTRDVDALVKGLLLKVIPPDFYVPGLGLVVVVAGILCVGLLMYPWLTRKLLDGADRVFRRIPLFGMIYSPARDLMDMFGGDVQEQLGQVVLIKIPNTSVQTLGFITREDLSGLPEGFPADEHVVVYVQWSSQIGGYCFVVPRDAVRPVDMTVEEGMRWALTAGISAPDASAPATERPDEQEPSAAPPE
jgi:uncharacterized membrane protein